MPVQVSDDGPPEAAECDCQDFSPVEVVRAPEAGEYQRGVADALSIVWKYFANDYTGVAAIRELRQLIEQPPPRPEFEQHELPASDERYERAKKLVAAAETKLLGPGK